MIYLDGFSGYGGFHLGLEKAGFKFDEIYFSEIDKYAIANYQYNFPNAKYAGSITDISRRTIPHIDVFSFGWPCQDNSIAGKRKGQSGDTRSGLLYQAVRIIDEFKPRVFFAENVEGLRTVNKGIDIVESLKILTVFNDSLPQYDIEMQLLNTRWFLPQNRERLFFIGHLRERGARKVFPIGEDVSRNNEGATKTAIVRTLTAGVASGGHHSGMTILCDSGSGREWREQDICSALRVGGDLPVILTRGRGYCEDSISTVSPTINACSTKDNSYVIANTNISGQTFTNEYTGTLRAGASSNYQLVNNIRRLTPIECERLQGLPDNHTKYGIFDGVTKEISDTQRYKLCGNGVSVPVVKVIGTKYLELNPQ